MKEAIELITARQVELESKLRNISALSTSAIHHSSRINDALTDAIIRAKNIPSEVLTFRYEASTVTTVNIASAPKTIRYTLI